MRRFSVAKQFDVNPQKSERATTVMRMFGISTDRLNDRRMTHACTVEVKDGDIVYITGPSGAGKSVLLREIQTMAAEDEKIVIEQIALPSDRPAIDCIGGSTKLTTGGMGVIDALSLLSYTGLSDVFCMLNAPANFSEGQKYRFRLACALASGKKFVFADEFCSNLDRITAGVIAYNVRRFAKQKGVTFFLASAHEDILADLQPDVLVVKNFTGEAEVTYKSKK